MATLTAGTTGTARTAGVTDGVSGDRRTISAVRTVTAGTARAAAACVTGRRSGATSSGTRGATSTRVTTGTTGTACQPGNPITRGSAAAGSQTTDTAVTTLATLACSTTRAAGATGTAGATATTGTRCACTRGLAGEHGVDDGQRRWRRCRRPLYELESDRAAGKHGRAVSTGGLTAAVQQRRDAVDQELNRVVGVTDRPVEADFAGI